MQTLTHGAKPGQVHHDSESHGVTLLEIVLSYDDLDQLTPILKRRRARMPPDPSVGLGFGPIRYSAAPAAEKISAQKPWRGASDVGAGRRVSTGTRWNMVVRHRRQGGTPMRPGGLCRGG